MSDINKRLIEARKKMKNPIKDKIGQTGHRKYSYATLDQIVEIITTALQEQELFLTQGVDTEGNLVTKVISEDSSIILDIRPMINTTDPQAYGSYETYMRRYSMLSVFCLAGEEDDDGSKAGERIKADNVAALVSACNDYALEFGLDSDKLIEQMVAALEKAPDATWKNSIENLYQEIKKHKESESNLPNG